MGQGAILEPAAVASAAAARMCYAAAMRTLRAAAASLVAIWIAGPVLGADLSSCRAIKGAPARLNCYDAIRITPPAEKSPSPEKAIAQWSGNGMTTTRPFHVDGPWELQWSASGFFQAFLKRAGGDDEIVANQVEAGSGSSYVADGGDYSLTVNAMERWTAKAVAVRPEQAPSGADATGGSGDAHSPDASKAAMFAAQAAGAGGLYICAEHADPDDWEDEFGHGPVVIPSGTVFDLAGQIMGDNLQDPKDWAHWDAPGWKGLPKEEEQRRDQLILEDANVDQKNTRGVVTTEEIVLTKEQPCGFAHGLAAISGNWGWTAVTITEDKSVYYQLYGILKNGALDTRFTDDGIPVNYLASRGELNASVRGTINRTMDLDALAASTTPADAPPLSKGNSDCWGDNSRQDISCRPLTEAFLLSMRGASRDAVVKAMGVEGRPTKDGLHFISNYAQGQTWGSGIVNFTFDSKGDVSIIDGDLDPPNLVGKSAGFLWNSQLLPGGCSDLPTDIPRMNGPTGHPGGRLTGDVAVLQRPNRLGAHQSPVGRSMKAACPGITGGGSAQ
jgi:hypothetical protein